MATTSRTGTNCTDCKLLCELILMYYNNANTVVILCNKSRSKIREIIKHKYG